jgi:hypothetical protein
LLFSSVSKDGFLKGRFTKNCITPDYRESGILLRACE